MNKNIELKAKTLNQWILDQEIVKEFHKYEKLIINNPELIKTEDELKQMQKDIVNQKHQGIDCTFLIQDYEKKKKEFDENPIIYNYLSLKEEVNELLNQVQDDINQQLKKKVD